MHWATKSCPATLAAPPCRLRPPHNNACCILLTLHLPAADADAAALLSLPAAVPNWDAATAALAGADWQQGSQPCGGGGAAAWKGATCTGGAVTSLALPGLGLTGTLPPALAGLASLQSLDLSGNAFSGGIPQAWLEPAGFSQLASALLNANQLGALGG